MLSTHQQTSDAELTQTAAAVVISRTYIDFKYQKRIDEKKQ